MPPIRFAAHFTGSQATVYRYEHERHQEEAHVIAQIHHPHRLKHGNQQRTPEYAEHSIAQERAEHGPESFPEALDCAEPNLIHCVNHIEGQIELYRFIINLRLLSLRRYRYFRSYSRAARRTTKQEPALWTSAPVVGVSTPSTERRMAAKLMHMERVMAPRIVRTVVTDSHFR